MRKLILIAVLALATTGIAASSAQAMYKTTARAAIAREADGFAD